MKTLTIFTPTYNRAYILPNLYDSLCRQNNLDFKWLIVDDGSTDETEQLVNQWIGERKIDIFYQKQPNGGKMRAHNLGVQLCDTPLFVCVDSDDFLTDNAIAEVLNFWRLNYHNEESICGVIAYRAMVINGDNPQIIKRFPSIRSTKMHTLMTKYGHKGETAIVLRTNVIKRYPFPEIDGEKFITEAYIYDQIDQKYEILLFDKDLAICEFLPDGYTRSKASIYKLAPKGWSLFYNQQIKLWSNELSEKEKLKILTYYIIMAQFGGEKNIYKNSNDKSFRYFIAYLIAPYFKWKLKKLFS